MSDQYPSPYDQSGPGGQQQGGYGQQPQPTYRATPATMSARARSAPGARSATPAPWSR